MIQWKADLFQCGHALEYINSIPYWEYIELINGIVDSRKIKSKGSTGKVTDTQRVMIENRKKIAGEKNE